MFTCRHCSLLIASAKPRLHTGSFTTSSFMSQLIAEQAEHYNAQPDSVICGNSTSHMRLLFTINMINLQHIDVITVYSAVL